MTTMQKPIRRTLPRPIERGDWVIELDAVGITFRQKRCKRRYPVSWESAWLRAMEIAAEELRRGRLARRKAGRR